jgi:alkylated DNA repair dioxygenase AlkB
LAQERRGIQPLEDRSVETDFEAMARSSLEPDLFAPDLFTVEPQPEGFAYGEDRIDAALQSALLREIEKLPFKPFEFHGFFGNRRTVSFGWRYDYAGRALQASDPMPGFLLPLCGLAADFAQLPADRFQQALVTEYAPGAGIGWHRDKPMFEDVVAFSLAAPCTLRFRRKEGAGWTRRSQPVLPRSAYLLRGPARFEWEHSIPPLDRLRYSITLRTFRPDRQPD